MSSKSPISLTEFLKGHGISQAKLKGILKRQEMLSALAKNGKDDGIVGRPIRLSKRELKPNGKHNYAEVVFIGDSHYGNPQCDTKRFLAMLEYCKTRNIYVFLMGDLIELAAKDSPGDAIFEQDEKGDAQYENMLGFLKPLAKKGLILGMLTGNHEERAKKAVGYSITKALARELTTYSGIKVPYLGHACWNKFKVGKQIYSVYGLHGRTGARFDGTVLKAVENVSYSFYCDLVVMGHAHKQVSGNRLVESVENGHVTQRKEFVMVTGSYLKYDESYWQMSGGQISKLGSPKVKFMSDRHDLSISW